MMMTAQHMYAITPVQRVDTFGGNVRSTNVFFDDGSSLCLVKKGFPVALGLVGRPSVQSNVTAGGESKDWDTMVYSVPLIKINGEQVNILTTTLE